MERGRKIKRSRNSNGQGKSKKKPRDDTFISSRKRQNRDSVQNETKRARFRQLARSSIVKDPDQNSTTEKHRKAYLDRKERARKLRLEAVGLQHKIESAKKQLRKTKKSKPKNELGKVRKEQDVEFLQGQIADLEESLNDDLKRSLETLNISTPVVHTLEEEEETVELLRELETVIQKDNVSVNEQRKLQYIVRTLRTKNLSPHQNARLGNMLAAISAKGWRIPRVHETDKMLIF